MELWSAGIGTWGEIPFNSTAFLFSICIPVLLSVSAPLGAGAEAQLWGPSSLQAPRDATGVV